VFGSASLSTRAEEQGARLWGGPDRTEEMGHALAWAGGALELSIELRGQISLYLAARALDASLLVDLAARACAPSFLRWLNVRDAKRPDFASLGTVFPFLSRRFHSSVAQRTAVLRMRAGMPLALIHGYRRLAVGEFGRVGGSRAQRPATSGVGVAGRGADKSGAWAELGGAARAPCFCPLIEALDRSIHSRYCGRRALDPLEPRRGQERSEGAP